MASPELVDRRVQFHGPLWAFVCDRTHRHVDLEGALRSGKTTAALWKVILSCIDYPGIKWLICRYSDGDTRTKVRPRFLELIADAGLRVVWDAREDAYKFGNRSWVYAFGLKAQDQVTRYAKLRGLTLAGVYVDQAEELPHDIYEELKGRLSQSGMPQQLLLSPNPPAEDHWIAREFPTDNRYRDSAYYGVSVYDNAKNLDPETIRGLETAYPVGHAKHGPLLLGTRGLNVMGLPVYGPLDPRDPATAAFQRSRHVRALALDLTLPLYESIDYGKRHPCVVWAQYTPWAELQVLGGVLGEDLYLEDFAAILQQYRQRWFKDALEVVTCCDPAGAHNNSQGLRQNGVTVLQDHGIYPVFKPDSNTADVRLAMVERMAGHMRRRSAKGEAFGLDDTRWVRISATAVTPHQFLADGCEAGYVWDPHVISVSGKPMRRPKKDGWYEHGQNCLEYLEHNFGGVQPTLEQTVRHAAGIRGKERPTALDELERWRRANPRRSPRLGGRGGYR